MSDEKKITELPWENDTPGCIGKKYEAGGCHTICTSPSMYGESGYNMTFATNAANSYQHFTDPVAAAEQDVMGEMIEVLKEIEGHCAGCGQSYGEKYGISDILAKTKDK